MMKLKSNVITALIVIFFMCGGTVASYAQGVFGPNSSNNDNSAEKVAADSKASQAGGLFRDGGNWWDEIDEGEITDPLEDPEPTPIGEGILILSLFSGGYALLKRRSKKEA